MSNVLYMYVCVGGMFFRVQEQENQRQQLQEELEQLRAPLPEGKEASSQTEDLQQQVGRKSLMVEFLPDCGGGLLKH